MNILEQIQQAIMPTQEQKDNAYYLELINKKYNESKSFRNSVWDKYAMIAFAYYKGLTNAKYNRQTKNITWDDSDPTAFNANKLMQTIRAIRGVVSKYLPRWDVDGLPYGEIDVETERSMGDLLFVLYDVLEMKSKIKGVLLHGLLYGLGVFQYGYDENALEGQGAPFIEVVDPFDIYIDPTAKRIQDAAYVIKVCAVSVDRVKSNSVYSNTDDITADNQMSSSAWKSKVVFSTVGSNQKLDTVLVYEAYVREEDGIHLITKCNDKIIRHELTELEEMPFVGYTPDINPDGVIGEGWAKNMIPLIKMYNKLLKNNTDYAEIMLKGRYVKDPNSNVKNITNENGSIYTATGRFEQMQMLPLPATAFQNLQILEGLIEDMGGAQQALMGRAPQGVTAGIAFEQLIASNMTVIADVMDNMEISLQDLGEALLGMMSKYQTTSFKYRYGIGQDVKEGEVISGEVEGFDEMTKIPKKTRVHVSIVPSVAFTKSGKQEMLFKLRAGGDLDQKTLLDEMGLNSDEIAQRLAEERGAVMPQEPMQVPQDMQSVEPQAEPQEEDIQAVIEEMKAQGIPEEQIMEALQVR
jgi:hypothetical protein